MEIKKAEIKPVGVLQNIGKIRIETKTTTDLDNLEVIYTITKIKVPDYLSTNKLPVYVRKRIKKELNIKQSNGKTSIQFGDISISEGNSYSETAIKNITDKLWIEINDLRSAIKKYNAKLVEYQKPRSKFIEI